MLRMLEITNACNAQAARRNAEDHKKIQEAMVQIVQTVADARPRSNIFARNSDLDKAVRDLYVAVLNAVSFIIRYLRYKNETSRRSRMEGLCPLCNTLH